LKISIIQIIIFSSFLLAFRANSQTYIHGSPWQVDSTLIVPQDGFKYRFPITHRPLYQSTQIDKNNISLTIERDFKIDQTSALIEFLPELKRGDTLLVSYRRIPVNLKPVYRLFTADTVNIDMLADSLSSGEAQIRYRQTKIENPFNDLGTELQKSGSIMRGVKIGSNRDLTLNSGLNIELSGMLSDNVEIIAALTDESTPIQPEGNTQTLDEVDRIFVEFRNPYISGVVGDLNLKYENTQFANLNRKLQGINLLGNYNNQYVGGTVATTRGFFNRIQFIGQEGNQGPYQLTGKNGEREIIVLAGTEQIWINGEKMVRGESNDYIIEYGNGQVSFTNRRLISSESRIEIDFEYFPALQKFNRNAYGALAGGESLAGKLQYRASYYRESDNIKQVLGDANALNEEEKEILREAGDQAFDANLDGGKFTGDSLGSYIKIDTLINGEALAFYRYVGKNAGNYQVSFSYVGTRKGDYTRDRLGVYRWAGVNKGDYISRRLIPLPSLHEIGDAKISWNPRNNITLETELATSRLDRNTLSEIDDFDNTGNALNLNAKIAKQEIKIGRRDLGNFDLQLNTKLIENRFEAIDRFNAPDHQRYWNLIESARSNSEERSFQVTSVYRPKQNIDAKLNLGRLDKDDFSSFRYSGEIDARDQSWVDIASKYEYIQSKITSLNIDNNWLRYGANIKRKVWKLQPFLEVNSERRENSSPTLMNGFQFNDYGMGMNFTGFKYFSGSGQLNRRSDEVIDLEVRGRYIPQAETETQRYRLELKNLESTTASLEYVQRNKDYTKQFEEIKVDTLKLLYADAEVQDTVWQDRSTNLADFNLMHSRWKRALNFTMQYRVSTEQVSLKEKVYLDVGDGQGNLRFDDDLNEYLPDPDGKYLLFILPSGKFEPVTNLQSAFRLQYDPGRYWKKSNKSLHKLLSKFSGESYFRVEEETKESNLGSLYTLNLSNFQKEQTLRGTIIFNQDLFVLRRNRKYSFRLQYRYRDDLFNQFLDQNENEDRNSIDRSIRFDWRLTPKIKSQTKLQLDNLFRSSEINPTRDRDILSYGLDEKISYRPLKRWEIGIESEWLSEENRVASYPIQLWAGINRVRLNYAIPGKTRLSAHFEYHQVSVTNNPGNLVVPFEMAGGKKEGDSKNWQLRTEYTIAKNILFTFFYTGRDDAGFDRIIHTGQAEVRAFF